MAERTEERTREEDPLEGTALGDDFDAAPTRDPAADATAESTSLRRRVASRVPTPGRVFSVRAFGLVLVLALAATFLAGMVLPLGGLAGYLGIALVGFGLGLADGERRYAELLVGGGVASAVGTFVGNIVLTALGIGVPLVVVGAFGGAAAGVVGHYFGRDLRAGLTREV